MYMKNVSSLIIGLAFIIGLFIVARAYKYRSTANETITVTGSAEKDFVSDLIVWNGSYSRKSMDLKSAYAQLKGDENTIRTYLSGKGIQNNEMEFSGYNLIQNVRIESPDVEKIEKISREATELIEKGIEFNSSSPLFYYTRLTQIKMDLLAKASADGKARAEIIAKNAGNSLGRLKKATLGVFQITGKNSNEDYSYGGTFNTSNKNKTGTITIRMEFGVE